MATKTAIVTLADDDMRFDAVVGSGHTIVFDDGRNDAGSRPAELLGAALAACTAMDVISILRKKRQMVTHYEVRVSGHQREHRPHAFSSFEVVHVVEGKGVDPEAVRRSVELSATKYCSVGSTLATGALEIRHTYVVRDEDGTERTGEVCVIGPNASPDGDVPAS